MDNTNINHFYSILTSNLLNGIHSTESNVRQSVSRFGGMGYSISADRLVEYS